MTNDTLVRSRGIRGKVPFELRFLDWVVQVCAMMMVTVLGVLTVVFVLWWKIMDSDFVFTET